MRYIGDFHIHSHYSRATSKDMNIEELDRWARIKGIQVLGTGDFTHPQWFRELREKLEPAEEGLFKLKDGNSPIRFMLTVEVSSIYSQGGPSPRHSGLRPREGGQVRRIHNIVFAPSFETAAKINRRLGEVGNLRADGRPILGLPARELLRMVLDVSEDCLLVPAHIWTPWFSLFGSKSGFDSIEECFGDLSPYIYAIETGLSSDPAMNWRLSALDNITILSNSDCHSARRIGREANVFEGEELSYKNIIGAIKFSRRANAGDSSLPMKLVLTIEFFPEEGKYHYDGHRDCKVRLAPSESKKVKAICPRCGGPVTVGVLSRVEELADRRAGYVPENAVPYRSMVPLDEIIAEAMEVGPQTKRVTREYDNLTGVFGNEFAVLLEAREEELEKATLPEIVEAIRRVRSGQLSIEPGYDGEYGKVKVFNEGEKRSRKEQGSLFAV